MDSLRGLSQGTPMDSKSGWACRPLMETKSVGIAMSLFPAEKIITLALNVRPNDVLQRLPVGAHGVGHWLSLPLLALTRAYIALSTSVTPKLLGRRPNRIITVRASWGAHVTSLPRKHFYTSPVCGPNILVHWNCFQGGRWMWRQPCESFPTFSKKKVSRNWPTRLAPEYNVLNFWNGTGRKSLQQPASNMPSQASGVGMNIQKTPAGNEMPTCTQHTHWVEQLRLKSAV